MKQMLILTISLFLFGCSLSPVKTQPKSNYTLKNVSTKRFTNKPSKYTVLVSTPIASPGYQTPAMIYTVNPYELRTYSRNRWVAAPAQMFEPLVAQSLKNTGYFHAVVSAPFAGLTDLRVDTKLYKLQQNFLKNSSEVSMVLQVDVVSLKTNKVIAGERFAVAVPAPTNNPYGQVIAANEAAQEILEDISEFVVHEAKTL